MPLIGPLDDYTPIDLPDDARPSPRFDQNTLGDTTARLHAAVGWLAHHIATSRVGVSPTRQQYRDAVRDAAAHIHHRIATADNADDNIDYFRLISAAGAR